MNQGKGSGGFGIVCERTGFQVFEESRGEASIQPAQISLFNSFIVLLDFYVVHLDGCAKNKDDE